MLIIVVTCIWILWHSQVWVVYVLGPIDSSADRFCVPVWELSALKLWPVEHVSWILNTPDFGYVPVVIMPVCWCAFDRNKYSRSRLFSVKILSLLKASMTVPQWEFPVLWFIKIHSRWEPILFLVHVTSFNINIRQFCQWSVSDSQHSGDATWASLKAVNHPWCCTTLQKVSLMVLTML